jgi:hypothetical protein
MSNNADINRDAWELAIVSFIKGGKIVPYSTSQIRNIISASQSDDFQTNIPKVIEDYKPATPQGVRENDHQAQQQKQQKREKNLMFGKSLMEFVRGRNSRDVQMLLKYTLWNIKIIEKLNANKKAISLLLECERIEKSNEIQNKIDELSGFQSNNQNKGHFNKGDRRR